MGLYLCVFDDDEELEGVEIGNYADFQAFRNSVSDMLEGGIKGARFPTLILHFDSDGEWSHSECDTLKRELTTIANEFTQLPAKPYPAEWQRQVGDLLGLKPTSLHESFIDVDGEPLLDRLVELCDIAIQRQLPIVFQ